MKNEYKLLIERLERLFPRLKLLEEGHEFGEFDYAPPCEIKWHEFIKILENDGLVIANKKDVKN